MCVRHCILGPSCRHWGSYPGVGCPLLTLLVTSRVRQLLLVLVGALFSMALLSHCCCYYRRPRTQEVTGSAVEFTGWSRGASGIAGLAGEWVSLLPLASRCHVGPFSSIYRLNAPYIESLRSLCFFLSLLGNLGRHWSCLSSVGCDP